MIPTLFAIFQIEPWSLVLLGGTLFAAASLIRRRPLAVGAPVATKAPTRADGGAGTTSIDVGVAA
jgi:hypothetical protein